MISIASMLAVPAAPRTYRGGDHREPDPVEARASCARTSVPTEWVPDRETSVVPDALSTMCRRCPLRTACLRQSLAGHEQGYWAGTTTKDREAMRQLGRDDVDTADSLQELAFREVTDGALHPLGEGNYSWYRRRGCRCGECKSANAHVRALERTRSNQGAA